jgi:hypothetical protein
MPTDAIPFPDRAGCSLLSAVLNPELERDTLVSAKLKRNKFQQTSSNSIREYRLSCAHINKESGMIPDFQKIPTLLLGDIYIVTYRMATYLY